MQKWIMFVFFRSRFRLGVISVDIWSSGKACGRVGWIGGRGFIAEN